MHVIHVQCDIMSRMTHLVADCPSTQHRVTHAQSGVDMIRHARTRGSVGGLRPQMPIIPMCAELMSMSDMDFLRASVRL